MNTKHSMSADLPETSLATQIYVNVYIVALKKIVRTPYANTERLGQVAGGVDLRGCRSARVDRNFRVIFVICEECQHIRECQYCFCEHKEDATVVFLTVGPHNRAYTMK